MFRDSWQNSEGFSQQAITRGSRSMHVYICTCSCVWYGSWLFLYGTALVNLSYLFYLGLCTARLGLEAPALAWLEAALALSNLRPSQSRHSRLGSGLAWPRPWLLYVITFKLYFHEQYFVFYYQSSGRPTILLWGRTLDSAVISTMPNLMQAHCRWELAHWLVLLESELYLESLR